MRSYSLKCYNPKKGNAPLSGIFLLSRGKNSGRPAFEPNANCIILECKPDDIYYFYWLAYGLWFTERFRPVLCGTCVEVLRIGDLRRIIDTLNTKGHLLEDKLPALVKGIQLQQQLLKKVEQLKYAYVSMFGLFNRMEEKAAASSASLFNL